MEFAVVNNQYLQKVLNDCTFSFKGAAVDCSDFIALKDSGCKDQTYLTLRCSLSWDAWSIPLERVRSLTLTVIDNVFQKAKRVLRRAVAGVRHFVCSNQRGMRRVAPMVPMALRL